MLNHTTLLNFLVERYKLKSYLEIGVHTRAINFDKIRCKYKVCVDPAVSAMADFEGTSDDFFKANTETFDLIFIDGLHHADQVKKDFDNSLKVLNPGGIIMLHDCSPALEKYTHVPRDSKIWCGDVYKFAASLSSYDNIGFVTADFDHGCTVVWKQEGVKGEPVETISWPYFSKNRHQLLNLVNVNDIHKYLP